MTVASGASYCGEHGDGERVPCPLDPKHSCFVATLEKHIKKCNAKQAVPPSFIIPQVNTATNPTEEAKSRNLSDLNDQELQDLVEKVDAVADGLEPLKTSILNHKKVDPLLKSPECGVIARKHLLQNGSLLANIEKHGFVNDNVTFVEFGAGRGQLTFWLSEVLHDKENCSLILIDRASTRHKLDNKLKGGPIKVTRVRADIADLDLSGVVPSGAKVVGVCKHLCGEGTDLSLQCLLRAARAGVKVAGLVMAPCCHHRCTWRNFLGQEFLVKNGFSAETFTALCGITSWATCGNGRPRSQPEPKISAELHPLDRYSRLDYSQPRREQIGRKAKMILNHARLSYVAGEGLHGHLFYYIDDTISPENVCFIAR